jgi:phosphoribosylformimino-5-aminoimidazole carboxamide ribotide isomerase
MKFRPCIDLHQGQVKQIVGSTLTDDVAEAAEAAAAPDDTNSISSAQQLATNFATNRPASEFAALYQTDKLTGGHVIMLGPGNREAAMDAIRAYPNGLQVGGGITDANCTEWINAGASHVIVTSHVFADGAIHMDRLARLRDRVTRNRLILDLSCRRRPGSAMDSEYFVVTDRWQKFTTYPVNQKSLEELAGYCDEFLVHGVDVEGKQCGILEDLVLLLGKYSPIPVTYAGGVRSIQDLELVERLGEGRVDCTVGSALDIFGGSLKYEDVVAWHNSRNS